MTFDRTKIIAEGGTYHGPENPIIECASFTATKVSFVPVNESGAAPASIQEDANLPKRMMIEGVFQREGVRNANGRLYPKGMFERLLKSDGPVGQRIKERAMIGHLEHPENGTTDLNKGAILIIEAWVEPDGTVMGRALVYNTPEGLRIQEYIATGTKIGISSRGTGTVDAKGQVCEDYALDTWDMVYNPSTPGAHPGLKTESAKDEPVVRHPLVAETKSGTIPASAPKDKPMSVSAQLAEMKQKALGFLAIDARKLDESGRAKLVADLLDLRVEAAEKFQGEKRVPEVVTLLSALEEAKKVVESTMSGGVGGAVDAPAAPEGQADTGVPGGGLDGVAKLIGIASPAIPNGTDAVKAWEAFKSAAALVAQNIGRIPQIQAAIESAIKDEAPKVDESAKALLIEARDEIIKLTEANEAASAIIEEMRSRIISLKELSETAKANEAKAVEALAELTRVDTASEMKKAVEEACAKHPTLVPFKDMLETAESPAAVAVKVADLLKRLAEAAPKTIQVEEAAPQAPAAKKTVVERIRKPSVDESALPATGSKVESKKDAGIVDKSEIAESTSDRGLDALAKCMPKVQAIVEGRSAGIPG